MHQWFFFNGASKPKLGASNFVVSKCTFLHDVLYSLRRSLEIGFDYGEKSQQKSFDGDKRNDTNFAQNLVLLSLESDN